MGPVSLNTLLVCFLSYSRKKNFLATHPILTPPHVLPQIKDGDAVKVKDTRPECSENEAKNYILGGLFHDLGVVEPDDDPLAYVVDEEKSEFGGKGRPAWRPLVAPVDPKLAVSCIFTAHRSFVHIYTCAIKSAIL